MKFATLTFDRGDRPKLFDHCKRQLARQSMQLENIFVTYPPQSDKIDIVDRFEAGVNTAYMKGIDFLFIIESDDWYHEDYLKIMYSQVKLTNSAVIGIAETIYYHIAQKGYVWNKHPQHSSLFCTGISVNHARKLKFPKKDHKFLDGEIFKTYRNGHFVPLMYHKNLLAIGIKHNEGLRAGIGHRQKMKIPDKDMKFLKQYVDPESFEFYNNFY